VKIVIVHNRYRGGAPGGEDVVVDQETRLLASRGVEVAHYSRSNDEMSETNPLDVARVMAGLRRSSRTVRELPRLLREFAPDVAHFHNVFPLVSPVAYELCAQARVPIVQTLHNYRLSCAAATHFRDGSACQLCSPTVWSPAIRHRCYRGTRVGSWAVANMLKSSWRDGVYSLVDRFIVLTEFAASWLTDHVGVPSSRVVIKPNFVELGSLVGNSSRQTRWIYAGKLSAEKGVLLMLEAWRELKDIPLLIVGDGPLAAQCRQIVAQHRLPVTFTGFLPRQEALAEVAGSVGMVFPSQWYEGLPMVLLESWALGTPVVAARVGAAASLIDNEVTGMLHDPNSPSDLARCVRLLHQQPNLAMTLSAAGRQRAAQEFGAQANFERLMHIYRGVKSLRQGA
jgi:glycosyltransferase involved in cell wall biosynthesis